jgi:hypothetical protein
MDLILEHERVDDLADPPRCPKCDADVRHVRTLGGANLGKLHWTCTTTHDGDKCGWIKPFSDPRNQEPAATVHRRVAPRTMTVLHFIP